MAKFIFLIIIYEFINVFTRLNYGSNWACEEEWKNTARMNITFRMEEKHKVNSYSFTSFKQK